MNVYGIGDLIGSQNAAVNLVPPACAQDISGSISVKRSGYIFNWNQGVYNQTITLTNNSTAPIPSPIALALDNLGNNVNLYNLSGNTACTRPQNPSQFINVSVSQNPALAPKTSVNLILKFSNPSKSPISYSTRVLSGTGMK